MTLFIGLISGTSMDGIDAALFDASTHTCLYGLTYPYQDVTKHYLNKVLTALQPLSLYSQLNTLIGRDFAKATQALLASSGYHADTITAIGSHGQTLCHEANADIPYTVQLGCAHSIASLTGISVVSDFRTRDVVNGGQGAPFAPVYHQQLAKRLALPSPLVFINIGGIANISVIDTDNHITGYDTGPGNCLMDAWTLTHLGLPYDRSGHWAGQGEIVPALLNALLTDPFFKQPAPKSIGTAYFSKNWLNQYASSTYAAVDVQATLLQLTALTITDSIKVLPKLPEKVLICGGGVHNQALINKITALLPECCVQSTQAVGVNPDFIEASMFAWLAYKTINDEALNLSQITGAKKPAILGAIYL